MKQFATLLILVFHLTFSFGQEDFIKWIGKPYHLRQAFLLHEFHIHPENLDSAQFVRRVEQMENAARKNQDLELILECEFIRLNYLSSRNATIYLREIYPFLEKVDKSKVKQLQIRARQSLANHYFDHKRYGKAMDFFEQSYTLLKDINHQVLPDKQEMLYNIAYAYYRIGYYNTSLQYLNLASEISNNYYPTLPLNILNIQGLIHQKFNAKENVMQTYQILIDKAISLKNDTWIQVGRNNLAHYFVLNGDFGKALESMSEGNYSFLADFIEDPILLDRESTLFEIYLGLGEKHKAISTASIIEQLVQSSSLISSSIVYKALGYLAYERNDYAKGKYYLQLAIRTLEEQQTDMEWRMRQQADDKESVERYFKQQTQLNNEKALTKSILVSAIIIILLLFIVAAGYIKRQRTHFKNKQLEAELERVRIKEQLQTAQAELMQMTDFLLSKNKELNIYREELAKIENSNTSDVELLAKARQLNDLLSKPILTEENWQQFKRTFEGVHVDFFHRLNLKLPGLTPSEVRYLVLRKLRLSRNEIADLLGISPDSIRQYRHRILKKYQLNSDEDIELLIQNI